MENNDLFYPDEMCFSTSGCPQTKGVAISSTPRHILRDIATVFFFGCNVSARNSTPCNQHVLYKNSSNPSK